MTIVPRQWSATDEQRRDKTGGLAAKSAANEAVGERQQLGVCEEEERRVGGRRVAFCSAGAVVELSNSKGHRQGSQSVSRAGGG